MTFIVVNVMVNIYIVGYKKYLAWANQQEERMAAVSGGVKKGGVSLGWLARSGAVAVAVAVVVNVVIRTVAVSVLGIGEGFLPLGVGPTVFFTVVGMVGAVVVFGLILRFAKRPVRLFRRVALVVLLVSLVPDVLMLFSGSMPGATVASVGTLMVEHVASWAVAVGILTRSVWEKEGERRG